MPVGRRADSVGGDGLTIAVRQVSSHPVAFAATGLTCRAAVQRYGESIQAAVGATRSPVRATRRD